METFIGHNIETAQNLLEQGKLVAIPTETVYGLAANALDVSAVIKIFEAKSRPAFNPLIIHTYSWSTVDQYAMNIPAKAHILAKAFSPGPLTFLLPRSPVIPDLVTAGSSLVAIRIPDHPLTLSLLSRLSFPVAAPSANESGYISPTTAMHVWDSLQGKIEYILDGDASGIGVESTIIGFDEQERVLVHRVGGTAVEAIELLLGETVIMANTSNTGKPQSSGQLKSHYAPHKELYIGDIESMISRFRGKRIASINFSKTYKGLDTAQQFVLSEQASLAEAATALFQVMREVDKMNIDIILTETFPDYGLGKAINDRLSRAQAIYKTL